MIGKRISAGYRLVFALLGLGAMGVKFVIQAGQPGFDPVSFFSYFTNLSVIFASLVLMWCLVSPRQSAVADQLRGAAVVYMAITGIVYNTLLGGGGDLVTVLGTIDTIEHKVLPIAIAIDWLIVPPANRLAFRWLPLWLVFPIGFAAYSLVRGAIVGWYPYTILDPGVSGGYGGVGRYVVAIAVGAILLTTLVTWIGNSRRRSGAPEPKAAPAR